MGVEHVSRQCSTIPSNIIFLLLMFAENLLVAVLVQFSDKHQDAAGMWFLESSCERLTHPSSPTFAHLEEAPTWIAQRLTSRR